MSEQLAEDQWVSFKELAAEVGMDRSHFRRYIIAKRVEYHRRRTQDSGGQLTLCLSSCEADKVRAMRRAEGFVSPSPVSVGESGFFYVVALVPELDRRRIKLGFAEDVATRLAQHRTSAPTATLVASWPCKRSWERTAMDCLVAAGCALILNEVFQCEDVDGLVERGNKLFDLLPSPDSKPDLSPCSPLNT